MSIESGRYVRIEENGQQNDSGGVGRTRIQDKIRQPSCFLAHGEQVSCWAFFFSHAPIFAHGCISILHRCNERFITTQESLPDQVTDFDETLWGSLAVYAKGDLRFMLACEVEITA